MTEIHLNLNNFLNFGMLLSIFPESNKYGVAWILTHYLLK